MIKSHSSRNFYNQYRQSILYYKRYFLVIGLLFSIMIPQTWAVNFKDQDAIPLWAEDSVEVVRTKSIMTGYSDGTFRPDEPINRAQALTIIFRTKKIDTGIFANQSNKKFKDISEKAWFRNAVAGAVKKGWAQGDPDGNFSPERTLNRAEWSMLLMRAFELEVNERDIPTFMDVPANAWFADSVFSLHNHELIRYPKASNYDPEREVTRAEAAWTIAQILSKPALMGTAAETNYQGYRIGNNRRVAVKPRDLQVEKQGIEETRKDLTLTTITNDEAVIMSRESDWIGMGSVKITNPFDNEVELNSIEFALRFDGSVGPSQSFAIQIANAQFAAEKNFSRTGRVIFITKDTTIKAGESITFKVTARPIPTEQFFAKIGTGKISLQSADALMWVESNNSNATISRYTSVLFENRDLKTFTFDPTVRD